jgi:hypothetical protein
LSEATGEVGPRAERGGAGDGAAGDAAARSGLLGLVGRRVLVTSEILNVNGGSVLVG